MNRHITDKAEASKLDGSAGATGSGAACKVRTSVLVLVLAIPGGTIALEGCGQIQASDATPVSPSSGGAAGSDGGTQSDGGADGGQVEISEDGGDPNQCERVVELQAVTLGEAPPFDVVIVADHSDSLSWSRDDLASGLATLLTNVRGRDVRLFVLTPTQYGASTEAAEPWLLGSTLISWKDPVTGVPYPNAMTEYHVECSDASGVAMECPEDPLQAHFSFTAKGVWEFQMPDPVAVITSDMTDSELDAQRDTLSAAILGLGGGGAQVEQPLCTLNRYIVQDRGLLPEHAVFLVISDEDDTTDGRNCLVGHTFQQTVDGETLSACSANCDEYRYSTSHSAPSLSIVFDCVPVDDLGTEYPELGVARAISVTGIDCAETAEVTCSADDTERAARQCTPSSVVRNCTASCSLGATRSCTLTRDDASLDLCSEAFDEGSVTYANLVDYCERTTGESGWSGCSTSGYVRSEGSGSPRATFIPDRIVSGLETKDLIDAFHAKAQAAFGADGYVVQAIILDPEFSCEPQAGQSYGTNLRAAASSPDDVFPICEPYGAALSGIEGFAEGLVRTEYPLSLESDEVVESVVITDRQGNQRDAPAGSFSHDPETGVLSFSPGVLSANDAKLDVEVVANCRRKVR